MKFIHRTDREDGRPTLELTRRNLEILLAKLDDPHSHKRLICPGNAIEVRAVKNDEHYLDRQPGPIYMPSSGEISVKLDLPINKNYAATVVRVPTTVTLSGLDFLVGVPVFGHQALTQNTVQVGELRVAFTAETQLSEEYARENDLHRDADLNKTGEVGYLEKHRRIKALKLKGHRSDALLMALSSLAYTGINTDELQEGDTFDTLVGHEICRKYEVPVKNSSGGPKAAKLAKAFKRVDERLFPMHLDTDNFFRNSHLLNDAREAVVSQKLHGTSARIGRVPVLRSLSAFERALVRLRLAEVV